MRVDCPGVLSSAVSLFALLALACGEHTAAPNDPPAPSASAEPQPTVAEPQPTASEPVASPPQDIPRAEVDALLTGWLDAQNRGDFAAYEALYALRFAGIRRTARAELRLDRDGWLEDRRRLFGRPMTVAMSDVSVTLAPTTAVARFTQRWSSGRYSEEGPKRIVLVREGGALRISSEEMLAARPVAAPRSGDASTFAAFDTQASVLVVLGEAPSPGEGAPRLLPAQGARIAIADPGTAIPPELSALRGRSVQLIGERGACSATLDSLGVASVVVPHFGTEQQWTGEDFDDSTPAVATPPAEIALAVASMAEHHYWVGVASASTCGRVRAAVLADRAPAIWPLHERTETASAVASQLFTGALLRELVDELREGKSAVSEEPAGNDASLEGELRSALVIRERALDPNASVIEARLQFPGECGGHERVFFFTRAGETITRLELAGWRAIDAVIDVQGDGRPELVVEGAFGADHGIVELGPTPRPLAEWSVSNLDCGC